MESVLKKKRKAAVGRICRNVAFDNVKINENTTTTSTQGTDRNCLAREVVNILKQIFHVNSGRPTERNSLGR